MSVTYGIIQEIYEVGKHKRVSYGIAAYINVEINGTSNLLFTARDLSSEREPLEDLVNKLNRTQISELHYEDIVNDFLTST